MLSQIRKRDGRIVAFDPPKIAEAVNKAFFAVGIEDRPLAQKLSSDIADNLETKFSREIPSVEDVQDAVEKALIKAGQSEAAKAYILYRERHTEIREAKKVLGVTDDLKLSVNAVSVLERRYLIKDSDLRVVETPGQLFRRVAHAIAAADARYGKSAQEVCTLEDTFYSLFTEFLFLPNSPSLMNAGTSMGQLSACFVVPIEDSMESIFDAVKAMALIHQSGGGTGFSFSKLRPAGDVVRSTGGVASGPISFMRVFDTATDVIKQGGKRRGANMGILRVDHPDILTFIRCKEKEGVFSNFNISVALTDSFMQAVKENRTYALINPHNGQKTGELSAKMVFDFIAGQAWKSGDPGLIFIDEINRHNPTPTIGIIESTNPCGEQPLLAYESCNLGSVNLSRMVAGGVMDWDKLKDTVRKAVHFLDNVIDANKYPMALIEKNTRVNRKIGLGVMGYAEMLIQLGIPYDSDEALAIAEKVMAFIDSEAKNRSEELGLERGSFPNFAQSIWKGKYKAMRNATVTTLAPTGSISIIADCSSGIEPLFSVSFMRNVMGGVTLLETNKFFELIARKEGFYSEELMLEVAKIGSAGNIQSIPERIRHLFSTAHEISPEWHVRMQAAFQKHIDNAVSKTINLPANATPKEIEDAYLLAYDLKCKGITVYRYGSKGEQVLYLGTQKDSGKKYTTAESEYSGGCESGSCPL